MQTWFKNHIYTEEIFSNLWRFNSSSKLDGNPIIQTYKKCNNIEDINLWEILFYEPGGVAVYRAYDPYCDLLMIVHEILLTDKNTIELYHIETEFRKIINRLQDLGISVNDRI